MGQRTVPAGKQMRPIRLQHKRQGGRGNLVAWGGTGRVMGHLLGCVQVPATRAQSFCHLLLSALRRQELGE